MSIDVPLLAAFNRGIISKKALARVDVGRVALSAEEQTNWMPRVLGSMSLRPGMKYLANTLNDLPAIYIPFVFAADDTALIELTANSMRVWDGQLESIVSRGAAVSTITNGNFTTDLTGWTDADESGAVSNWTIGNRLGLLGTGFNRAIRRQQVTVSSTGIQQFARVVVRLGPVTIKIGSGEGGDNLLPETTLRTGTHSLGFTPDGSFWVELSAVRRYQALVDSIQIEGSGPLVLPTPWGQSDLEFVRHAQSRDVIFVNCPDIRPMRIERYGKASWSIVDYDYELGPFRDENVGPVVLTPTGINGDIAIEASKSFFRTGHIGALFQLTSFGQKVEAAFSGEDQFSDPVRITGTGNLRRFSFSLAGLSGTGTSVTLQRSVGEPGAWVAVASYTSNGDLNFSDNLDNQVIFYRLGIQSGDYNSGTIDASIEFSTSGTITGVAKITGISGTVIAFAIVLKALGGTDGTSTWAEGAWSPLRGFPSAIGLFEGRLWHFGKDRIDGSVSDSFNNFDPLAEGDSGPIARAIGEGPTEVINWMLPMQRMLVGAQLSTFSAKSSSLDEPLTASAFSLRAISSQGTAAVSAVKVDTSGFYVQRNKRRLYELLQSDDRIEYRDEDITALAPEIGFPSIARIAVQRQPDTRVHCVRSDGKVAVLVFDRAEQVRCWVLIAAGGEGFVEEAVTLPGDEEDQVYYLVRRTINGNTSRSLELWAIEDDIVGGPLTKLCDSFVEYSGTPTSTVNLPHLEGQTVVVWADGNSVNDANGDVQEFVVSSGTITLPFAASNIVAGLKYRARFKSSKLAYASPLGTALTMRKKVSRLGLVLANTHHRGLLYGQDFEVMDDLPQVEDGAVVVDGNIWEEYDKDNFSFPGSWSTDSRICLEAASPRPCTVLAASFVIEGHRAL